jgi:L-threonine kinase
VAGKIGELIQGWHPRYGAFFVSAAVTASPDIDRVYIDPFRPLHLTSRDGRPYHKASRAVKAFVELLGVPFEELRGQIELERSTPEGKGRGSSSIDTWLAIRGVAEANDLPAHPRTVYAAQCQVERSDPVHLPESLVVAQPEDGEYQVLGPQPKFLIVGWDTDPDGSVDTQQAASLDAHRRQHAAEYADLLAMIRTQDPRTIARAATRSSRLNHQWLPKRGFEAALDLAEQCDAGLISAHTGTYLGLLLEPDAEPALIGRGLAGVKGLAGRPELFLMGGKS